MRGEPIRYIDGHNRRLAPVDYVEDPDSGCWVWQKSRDQHGYGRAYVKGDRSSRLAYRVYYERLRGPVPAGLELDHLCRNPACVNPDHLEPVTHQENVRRGAACKLGPDQVRAIRASDETHVALASRFGVTGEQVRAVRAGLYWADVEAAA